MILQVFSVRDSKAGAFLPPFFSPNIAVAERSFAQAANESGHAFHIHAKDYDLFLVGSFNDNTGKLKTIAAPQHIGSAYIYLGMDEEPEHDIYKVGETPEGKRPDAREIEAAKIRVAATKAGRTHRAPDGDALLDAINGS